MTIQTSQIYATTIPVINNSGTTAFVMNMDTLLRKSIRKVGVKNPTPDEYENAISELNLIMQDLQNQSIHLWKQRDCIMPLIANEPAYYTDPLIIDASDWFFKLDGNDTLITPMTKTNYMEIPTKSSGGNPNMAYINWQLQQPIVTFYPIYGNSTGFVLGTNSKYYICKQGHTSTTDNQPITGENYADFWEETEAVTDTPWTGDTDYNSGCVHFTGTFRFEDMSGQNNDPDFTIRWDNALMWLLADALSPDFALEKWEREDIQRRAAIAKISALGGGKETSDMRIYPVLRR